MIHIVKGFGIVNKAEIDVFLELSCFFHDPADVGNLISGSLPFLKPAEGYTAIKWLNWILNLGLLIVDSFGSLKPSWVLVTMNQSAVASPERAHV